MSNAESTWQSISLAGAIFALDVTDVIFGGFQLATRFLGGTSEERLFMYPAKFDCDDDIIVVQRTDMPNMEHLIARHRGRYCIPAAFCRTGMRVLDFPCGSGYGMEILQITGIEYEGRDIDKATVEYCNYIYGDHYQVDDLTNPHLEVNSYDLICCIEGLEHIEKGWQWLLLKTLKGALKPGGMLVITTPEKSGETLHPHHKHELTKQEFQGLLQLRFSDVQFLSMRDVLHNGQETNLMFGICRKED